MSGLGLERAGVFAVYVDDALSEGIEPAEVISPEVRERALLELHDTFSTVTTKGPATRIPGEHVERLEGVVAGILRELRGNGHMVGRRCWTSTRSTPTRSPTRSTCA